MSLHPARGRWARYVRAFDRALLIMVGEGNHGETHEEIAISAGGLLVGTAFLAYFTSTLVSLVTSLNQVEAHSNLAGPFLCGKPQLRCRRSCGRP